MIIHTNNHPRTDDAEVFANFIGIAPQVDGPITNLPCRTIEFRKQGELLFEIDPRPYEYALEKARSDLSTLEGQIVDQRRTIASQVSAVGAARANTDSAPRTLIVPRPRSVKQKQMLPLRKRPSTAPTPNWLTRPTIFIALSRCWPSNSSP